MPHPRGVVRQNRQTEPYHQLGGLPLGPPRMAPGGSSLLVLGTAAPCCPFLLAAPKAFVRPPWLICVHATDATDVRTRDLSSRNLDESRLGVASHHCPAQHDALVSSSTGSFSKCGCV